MWEGGWGCPWWPEWRWRGGEQASRTFFFHKAHTHTHAHMHDLVTDQKKREKKGGRKCSPEAGKGERRRRVAGDELVGAPVESVERRNEKQENE